MTWIARTNGATTGEALELREGVLTDIAPTDRGNWRVVDNERPSVDGIVEQFVRTGLPIAANGTVSIAWQIVPEPVAVVKMRLEELAGQEALTRVVNGRVTRNGKQVSTSDESLSKLQNAKATIDAGIATTVTLQTAEGDLVDVGITPLNATISAVVTARQAVFAARKTIVDAIRAGTVTTSAAVRNHAAWPV